MDRDRRRRGREVRVPHGHSGSAGLGAVAAIPAGRALAADAGREVRRRPRRGRGRDPPRGPKSRRRAARHADRPLRGRRRGAAASAAGRRDASRALRHPVARPGHGRHLRGRLMDDAPARGGVWNPPRAGSPRRRRASPGPPVHGGVGGARRGVRSGAFGRRRARAPERALRPRARRSSGPRGRHASCSGRRRSSRPTFPRAAPRASILRAPFDRSNRAARPPLRPALPSEKPGLHRRGDPHAGLRHRREHRDVFPARPGRAAQAPRARSRRARGARRAGALPGRVPPELELLDPVLLPDVHGPAGPGDDGLRNARALSDRRDPRRRKDDPHRQRGDRFGELLRRPRPRTGRRSSAARERRPDEAPAPRGGARLGRVPARLRGQPLGGRANPSRQRAAHDDRRRGAEELPERSGRVRAGRLRADGHEARPDTGLGCPGRQAHAVDGHRGASQAGRLPRAGAHRARPDLPEDRRSGSLRDDRHVGLRGRADSRKAPRAPPRSARPLGFAGRLLEAADGGLRARPPGAAGRLRQPREPARRQDGGTPARAGRQDGAGRSARTPGARPSAPERDCWPSPAGPSESCFPSRFSRPRSASFPSTASPTC